MSPRAVVYLVTFSLAVSATQAETGVRKPATPADRAKAVEFAHSLEFDPLGPEAKSQRNWITRWLTGVSDISIKICPTLLGPLVDSKKDHAPEILGQLLPAAVAFVIAHPEKAGDGTAVYVAAVEGSLRAYESILEQKPKETNPFLEELTRKQKLGQLRAYVESVATRCQ
jgi:hypothetical protein